VPFKECESQLKELTELLSIVDDDDDESIKHVDRDLAKLKKKIDHLEFQKILGAESDRNNAIININAGAGGTESCDWVAMLTRMYKRWADDQEFEIKELDILMGEEAGIKNVTFVIRGPFSYGYLKGENGVHRLVRISPFDSNKRRHTSFASVEVIPEIDDDIKIEINPNELRIDTYRSGGAGGQHVNVTDSAVRITHIPTGTIAQCQNERSQHKNKAQALKILKSRLYSLEKLERKNKDQKQYDEKEQIAWGSQIRSYVLHPYNLVKDHRTDHETSNATGVLDGNIDSFLAAFLKMMAEKNNK
jgi:peptide chain release factor 2